MYFNLRSGFCRAVSRLAIVTTFLLLCTAKPFLAQGENDARHAIALTYRLHISDTYSLYADTQLIKEPNNTDFSAVFLMLIARHSGDSRNAPYVQVGLVRDARHHFALQSFVAVHEAEGTQKYIEGAFLKRAWHRLGVTRRGGKVQLFVDGAKLFECSEGAYFAQGDRLYIQIGAELRSSGDTIDSLLKHFSETDGGLTTTPRLECFRDDQGLTLTWQDGDSLRGHGTFDPNAPSNFHGDCAW